MRYLHTDHLGSTSLLTDDRGQVLAASGQGYMPYGKGRAGQAAPLPSEQAFTGQALDTSTGLMYYGARYYDSSLGRFIQPDTIVPQPGNPQNLNRYSYVNNNPLRYTDPSGHCPWCIAAPIGALIGAGIGYGTQVYGNLNSGMQLNAALTTDIDRGKIAAGAVLGATAVLAAPFAIAAAGEALMGAGVAANSAALFSTGIATAGAATKLSSLVYGAASAAPAIAESADGIIQGGGKRWGPYTGAGPIGEENAKLFRSASYTEIKVPEETTLYRVYGGNARQISNWWSRTQPSGPMQARIDSAIDPSWGNTIESVATIRVPAGTTIYEGFASEQGGLGGGGNQVYMYGVNPAWLVEP